jgi:hypothetical protein
MDSTALTGIRATSLLSRAATSWPRSSEALVLAIAPVADIFQGGAMAVSTMAPVTDQPTTDHHPLLGLSSCRPPV